MTADETLNELLVKLFKKNKEYSVGKYFRTK